MGKGMIKNLLLACVSVLVGFGLSVAADRAAGLLLPEPRPAGTMALLFPPGAEESFETPEFAHTSRINSLGLRDREIAPGESDQYRIVAIGDSFTYGWGVNLEDTWVKRLEGNLHAQGLDVQTVNAGAPGAGPSNYADAAERVLPVLKPDLVVVAMLHDDYTAAGPIDLEEQVNAFLATVRAVYPNLTRLLGGEKEPPEPAGETTTPAKKSSEENRALNANAAKVNLAQAPVEQQARFETLDDAVKEAFLSGDLNPFLIMSALACPNHYTFRLDLDAPFVRQCIQQTADHLVRIKRAAEAHGARAIVVSVPLGPYVNAHAYENVQRVGFDVEEKMLTTDAPDRAIGLACEKAGLPFYAVTETFRTQRDTPGLYYTLDGHFSPAGHKLYADSLTPILAREVGDATRRN